MTADVVELTQELIAIESPSQRSNAKIAEALVGMLIDAGFDVERLEYMDHGEAKVSLVARKGEGSGGLCLFSHSDTVPGDDGWEPFTPKIEDGRLIGRGSADMKGPLAATLVAAAQTDAALLKKPLFIAITADEEVGYGGAKQILAESRLLNSGWPEYGVVAEPTQLRPVYAHKGGTRIYVTAHGTAAHTSTDKGVSANFLIAPFLAEMAQLAERFRSDEYFMDREFSPPTNGFNMVLDDGNCAMNVTAGKTICTLSLRSMPNAHTAEAAQEIIQRAERHGLKVATSPGFDPFYVAPDAAIVQAALRATGAPRPETVSFGTEAILYEKHLQAVVLGPGNIAQAHTVGEWIDIDQLRAAVGVYRRLIEELCM